MDCRHKGSPIVVFKLTTLPLVCEKKTQFCACSQPPTMQIGFSFVLKTIVVGHHDDQEKVKEYLAIILFLLSPYICPPLFNPHETCLSLLPQTLCRYLQFAFCSLGTPTHLYKTTKFGIRKFNIYIHGYIIYKHFVYFMDMKGKKQNRPQKV